MPDYQDYLSHYGIKGQKWGIRRFQEEGGDYTAEGRERYGIGSGLRNRVQAAIRRRSVQRNGPSQMSDDELNERLIRMRKEAEYSRLQREISGGNNNNQNNSGGGGKKDKKNSNLNKILVVPAVVVLAAAAKKIYSAKVDDLFVKHGETKMKDVMNSMKGKDGFTFENLKKAGMAALEKHSYGTAKDVEKAASEHAKKVIKSTFSGGGRGLSDLGLKDASKSVIRGELKSEQRMKDAAQFIKDITAKQRKRIFDMGLKG